MKRQRFAKYTVHRINNLINNVEQRYLYEHNFVLNMELIHKKSFNVLIGFVGYPVNHLGQSKRIFVIPFFM